jgi:hypothetical protein
MVSKFSRLALYAALVLGGTCAQADPFAGPNPSPGMLTFNGSSNGYATVNITYAALVSGSPSNVSAGQFKGSFDTDGGNAEADDFFRFFCIDLRQWAYNGTMSYTRNAGITDPTDAWQLTRLYENVYPNQNVGNFLAGSSSSFGDFGSPDASAAMQLAIWEIVFDDGLSLATGNLKATGNATVVDMAQGYLTEIANGAQTAAPGWQLYRFTNADKQDYLSATYVEPRITREGDPLPLPGTLALLGAGLAGIGFARRNVSQ